MYSGSKLMPDQILKHKVELRFGLKISQKNLEFVNLD